MIPLCTQDEFETALEATKKYAPAPPPGWKLLSYPAGHPMHGVSVYHRKGDKLTVLLTVSVWPGDQLPDRVWLHVSLSRPSRMPSYEDMADVKRLFVGKDRKAVQIFPEESQHVNIHPFCLHLWSCVEGETGLPDFGKFGTI